MHIKALSGVIAAKISKQHPSVLSNVMVELSTTYSPLHDIGKVGVSDAVFTKIGKLTPEEIHISARIVSVADVYDALRSPRPYKREFTHEEAMGIILKGDGRTEPTHFDPHIADE